MGRHQRVETAGLISFLICAVASYAAMNAFLSYAPAIWQVTQRRFMVCSGIVAACGVISFCIGYARQSHSWSLKNGWLTPIRRVFEILALSVVYASTIFLSSFALINAVNGMMGVSMFAGYLPAACAGFSGVVGYMTFVQAELMNAKTIASLLPFFVISGVCTAGLTTDDPEWYYWNFSRLGDSTTFAARMFNSTLMLAGTCVIIVSYFAISELITTERLQRMWHQRHHRDADGKPVWEIKHFRVRIAILSVLLTLSGLAFIGIGAFQYTPHKTIHNFFAKGLPVLMLVLFLLLPWLAPRLSKAMAVVSDLSLLVCAALWTNMIMGHDTLTNVEAVAGMLFLGWFIVFSRQIAAIEADRVQAQLLHAQALEGGLNEPDGVEAVESRIASDR